MDQITLHDNLPIIETADKLLLDTLIADPVVAHFIVVRLSDTAAAVVPDKFDMLVLRLRKIGHTPKVLEG